MIQRVYTNPNSQIIGDDQILGTPVPYIEEKADTLSRATSPISNNQVSAWDTLFTSNHNTKGGSCMQNMSRPKPRKIIELSFDAKSTA